MKQIKSYAKWIMAIGFLTIAGSVLHLPHWVASAAAIFSQPVSNVIEANRIPYQESFGIACAGSPGRCGGAIANDVPSGYQLVIDHVSVFVPSGSNVTSMSAQLTGPLANDYLSFPLSPGGTDGVGTPVWTGSQSTKIVVSSGAGFTMSVNGQDGGLTSFPDGFFKAMVTGYLEPCGAYPGGVCPAVKEN
jgi:hypothetical protein